MERQTDQNPVPFLPSKILFFLAKYYYFALQNTIIISSSVLLFCLAKYYYFALQNTLLGLQNAIILPPKIIFLPGKKLF